MPEITIPHAINTFIETDPPRKILYVVTSLAQSFGQTGFDAGAKQDMMVAISRAVAANSLDHYEVHWSATPPPKKPKRRPADVVSNAVHVRKVLTGEAEDEASVDDGKDPAAKALGAKGGAARARAMTPERRTEIARAAAAKRWAKEPGQR